MTFGDNNKTLIVQNANEHQLKRLIDALEDINYGRIPKGLKTREAYSPQKPDVGNHLDGEENNENQPLNCNRKDSAIPSHLGEANQYLCVSPRQVQRVPLISNNHTPKPSPARSKNTPRLYQSAGISSTPLCKKIQSCRKTPLTEQNHSSDANSAHRIPSVKSFYGSSNNMPPKTLSSSSSSKSTIGAGTGSRMRYGLSKEFSFRKRTHPLHQQQVQLTGFSNLGNTCYMNAILQSLLGIEPFAQDLANRELHKTIKSQCLFKSTYGLLCCKKNKCLPDIQRLHLRKFKRAISEAATRFSGHLQHDAHEFLCQVLDQLKEDVSRYSTKPDAEHTPNKQVAEESLCPVTRSFECAVIHTISCKRCGASVTSEEIYHDLSLDLPSLLDGGYGISPDMSGLSVDRLIETYFKTEELEYTCEECGDKHATISHVFSRLPRVLILHLKRYDFNKVTDRHAKKQNDINLTKFIDIGKLCTSKTTPPLTFNIKTVNYLSPPKSKSKLYKRPLDDEDDFADEFSSSTPPTTARRKLQSEFSKSAASTRSVSPGFGSESDNDVKEQTKIPSAEKPSVTSHTPKRTCRRPNFELDFDEIASSPLNIESIQSEGAKNPLDLPEEEQLKWALMESMKTAVQGRDSSEDMESGLEEHNTNPATKHSHDGTPIDDVPIECTDEELLSAFEESGYEDNKTEKPAQDVGEDEVMGSPAEEEQERGLLGGAPRGSTDDISIEESSDESEINSTAVQSKNRASLQYDRIFKDSSDSAFEADGDNNGGNAMNGAPTLQKFDGDLIISEDGCRESLHTTPTKASIKKREKLYIKITSKSPFNTKFRPKYIVAKDPNRTLYPVDQTDIYANSSDSSIDEKPPSSNKYKNKFVFKRSNRVRSRNSFNEERSSLVDDPTTAANTPDIRESFQEDRSPSFDDDLAKALANSLEDQYVASIEDEQVKQALELSMQEAKLLRTDQDYDAPLDTHGVCHNSADSGFQDDKEVGAQSYQLVSIVSHLGDKSSYGHYISDVLDCKTGHWTSYDDLTATKMDEHKVRHGRSKVGYILFYMYKQCVDQVQQAS